MVRKIDRTGEENINTFGSKMVITDYRNRRDIDVYFPEYNWTFKNVNYGNFKNKQIKCPYEKRYYGVGYLGEGRHKMSENGKDTQCYKTWHHMLERCYDNKYKEKHPTYVGCQTYEKWHNFQEYSEWFNDNYYQIEGERMALDKDILYKGNKIYSPDTCIFVPQTINNLFIKHDKNRGNSCIGSTLRKNGKYQVRCNIYDFNIGKPKNEHLGVYDTQEKAFEVYKQFKEKYIKEVADYYKEQIPSKLYDALYNYEVEIND